MKKILLLTAFTIFQFSLLSYAQQPNERIPVQFRSGNHTLSGELILPPGKEKRPAIVFLVGSAGASYRTNYVEWSEHNLEKQFLPEGIAILHFDKRGIGPSEGDWHKTDFYGRADDAKAAIDYLKTLPQIDSARIGVIGHSQGGWISQILASKYPQDIKFAVSLAGPTYGVRRQLVNDFESRFICDKNFDSEKAHRKAVSKMNRTFAVVSILPIQKNWRQLKVIKNFEPDEVIRTLKVPTLFLFAENDALVYPSWAITTLHDLFDGAIPGHITYSTIAGTSHSFRLSDLCGREVPSPPAYAPDFQRELKQYVLQHL